MKRKSSESTVEMTHDLRAIARHGVPGPVSAATFIPIDMKAWAKELSEAMERRNDGTANVDFSAILAEGRELKRSGKLDRMREEAMQIARAFEASGGLLRGKRRR